jgi:hypothetical protein
VGGGAAALAVIATAVAVAAVQQAPMGRVVVVPQ